MATPSSKGCFFEMRTILKHKCIKFSNTNRSIKLEILAFETAKIMARLIAIYKSISDPQFQKLKNDVTKSQGVLDDNILLRMACAEIIDDLDSTAVAVARLGKKCSDISLNQFDTLYTDLKFGSIDVDIIDYGSKDIEKTVEDIERLVTDTMKLYTALETLAELEIYEKRLQKLKNSSIAIQAQKMNSDIFDQKIENHRKQVSQLREVSLWNQTFDISVGLMARITCTIYARICKIFQPHLPVLSLRKGMSSLEREAIKSQVYNSGSGLSESAPKPTMLHYNNKQLLLFLDDNKEIRKNNRVYHASGPSTVGGSGLALRYANIILLTDKLMDSAMRIGRGGRENLYEILPEKLKLRVKSKLRKHTKIDHDESMVELWREEVESRMRWLVPLAFNTLRWKMERKYEKMSLLTKTPVLLVQTLHISDKEKIETAITEVMVGLSCLYRYENCMGIDDQWHGDLKMMMMR